MDKMALTITVVANMTANYGEGLGNISSVQKVFHNGRVYAARSRESLKNALMVQSGMYEPLEVSLDKVAQKRVDDAVTAATCRALEGGYMNTSGSTKIRKSSFYVTDAIACEPFVNDARFHNNLYLAQTYAKAQKASVQDLEESGLMPYQYEYDKSMKKYSLTIDLDKIGTDENFDQTAEPKERAYRVNSLLEAVQYLSLVVKGNLDNSEPLFVVGGIGTRKTHLFENVVDVKEQKLQVTEALQGRLNEDYGCALLGGIFANEAEIKEKLNPMSVEEFFMNLQKKVNAYYGV
jgi:CRISPR-associated protein Cst2